MHESIRYKYIVICLCWDSVKYIWAIFSVNPVFFSKLGSFTQQWDQNMQMQIKVGKINNIHPQVLHTTFLNHEHLLSSRTPHLRQLPRTSWRRLQKKRTLLRRGWYQTKRLRMELCCGWSWRPRCLRTMEGPGSAVAGWDQVRSGLHEVWRSCWVLTRWSSLTCTWLGLCPLCS